MVPKAEIEGEMGDTHVGLQARLMSQALRKLTGVIGKSPCVAVFINQLREKVGVMYGNPEVTTGGKALKFYASVRMDVRKTENLKNGDEAYGNHVKVKIVKNKVAPPFRVAEFDILYGKGISKSSEIIEIATALEVIQKSGSWFSYNGERIGQGKENARKYIEDNPTLMREIEDKIKSMKNDDMFREEAEYDEDEDEGFDMTEEDEDDGDFSIKLTDIDGD
jgi:recombination protein RecA